MTEKITPAIDIVNMIIFNTLTKIGLIFDFGETGIKHSELRPVIANAKISLVDQ